MEPANSFEREYKPGRTLAVSLLIGVLSSCGGNGQGLDVNGRPLSESGSDNTPDVSTDGAFNQIQAEILTPDCAFSGCHSGTTSPLGLNLDTGKSYANLINRESSQASGVILVEPDNADASYLIHKLEGTQSGGLQMPLAKQPLSADKIQLIRNWILDGAPPPETAPDNGGGGVPDPDPVLEAKLSSIQQLVFTNTCAGCHSGNDPLGSLDLSEGQSYAQLVGRASTIDPQGTALVSVGDAGGSFLMDKLRGTNLGTEGEADFRGLRMPIVGGYLDEPTVQIIEAWINAGALDN